jgi:polyisoprenoid-binding protein YceI
MTLLMSLFACSGDPEPEGPATDLIPADADKIVAEEDLTPPDGAGTTFPVTGWAEVVTIKNGEAEVKGSLSHLEGSLQILDSSWTGLNGTVTVGLESWASGDDVRDERLRRVFFQTDANPTAIFEVASVDGVPEGGFVVGAEPVPVSLSGKVTLSGATVDAVWPVAVTRPLEAAYVIESTEAVSLSIAGFGMQEQLAALITECGHQSVDDAAKVSVRVEVGEIPKEEPATTPAPKAAPAPKDPVVGGGSPLKKASKTKAPGLKGQKGGRPAGKASKGGEKKGE